MKKYNEFLNESAENTLIKKGQMVEVTMNYFVGKPTYEVEAHGDSVKYEGVESFSFLHGGDMMMIAKFDGTKWISD